MSERSCARPQFKTRPPAPAARARSVVGITAALAFAVASIVATAGVAVAAPAGSITGYVRANDGTAVQGATVFAWDWDDLTFEGEAKTDADGAYRITGLRSDTYRVRANADGYFSYYYDSVYTVADSTPVVVTDPNPTPAINFYLMPGRSILGRVYKDNGTIPIPQAQISVYESITDPGNWKWMADAYTLTDGTYKVTAAVGPGSYMVMARAMGYEAEYYRNARTLDTAVPAVVTAERDATSINFTLAQTGYISGTVYQADGVTPIGDATITARDSTTGGWEGYAHSSGNNGFYYINLPPGTYRLVAEAPGYVTEWYTDAEASSTAAPVAVVGVNETPNINFTLGADLAVTTAQASDITAKSARLRADLTSLDASGKATVCFEWGTTAGGPYPNSTRLQTRTGKGAIYANIEGLRSGTTYYYRARAVGDGDIIYGIEKSFTTENSPARMPAWGWAIVAVAVAAAAGIVVYVVKWRLARH